MSLCVRMALSHKADEFVFASVTLSGCSHSISVKPWLAFGEHSILSENTSFIETPGLRLHEVHLFVQEIADELRQAG